MAQNNGNKADAIGNDVKNVPKAGLPDPAKIRERNIELEKYLDSFCADKSSETLKSMVDFIAGCIVIVPAVFPKDADLTFIEEIKKGERNALPNDVKPMPAFLKAPDGKNFFGIYTVMEKVPKEPKYPMMMNIPFLECARMAKDLGMDGIVVNAYDQNVTFKKKALDSFAETARRNRILAEAKKNGGKIKLNMTPEQFHDVTRKNIELRLLPQFIFGGGEKYIDQICEGRENLLLEVFASPYKQASVKCPYTEDDFSVMDLNIAEDLMMLQIDLPEKELKPGSCRKLYIMFNTEDKSIKYYTIVLGDEGKSFIGQILAEGEHRRIEDAPDASGEMERIMELAKA